MKYKRILLKLSGESLSGDDGSVFDPSMLELYAAEIFSVASKGAEVAIVLGGGNIFRGLKGNKAGIDRIQGDYMGMLATLINSLALQSALQVLGLRARVLSGIEVNPVAEKMSSARAKEYLSKGEVVIIAGGTGNPFFTTDTAAALRAVETGADILLKGTRVDGIYTADPEKDKNAVKYETLTFAEAYEKNLGIMDMTAFTLCSENNMSVIVFDAHQAGNLHKIVYGEQVGTLVTV